MKYNKGKTLDILSLHLHILQVMSEPQHCHILHLGPRGGGHNIQLLYKRFLAVDSNFLSHKPDA